MQKLSPSKLKTIRMLEFVGFFQHICALVFCLRFVHMLDIAYHMIYLNYFYWDI